MRNSMSSSLRQNDVLTPGRLAQQRVNKQADLPLGEVAAERAKRREAVTYDRNTIVAKWLDEALDKHPKAAAIASECGISEAYLSQMRTGERTIPAHLFISLLAWSPSAEALLSCMAQQSGKFTVQPLRTVDPKVAQRSYIRALRSVDIIHAAARAKAAAECGTTEEDIEWAIEDTDVRTMGGAR
jgi:hypothetical protein